MNEVKAICCCSELIRNLSEWPDFSRSVMCGLVLVFKNTYFHLCVCVCGGGNLQSFIALVSESWEQPHQVLIFEVV